MERREALKGMGLALGYTTATPAILGLLQSCTSTKVKWVAKYISEEEGIVLENLVDLILPETDSSPGALGVNVPEFIDLYYGKAYDEESQLEFKEGMKAIFDELQISPETNPVSNIERKVYDDLLAKYLRTTKEEQELLVEEENLVFSALADLRNMSVWAYQTSQKIGEEVLAYDPIPGLQMGCVPLKETTGGKRWSL